MTTLTNIDSNTRDALRVWEHLTYFIALADLYSDEAIAAVRNEINRPLWMTGLTARQQRAALELLDATIAEANDDDV